MARPPAIDQERAETATAFADPRAPHARLAGFCRTSLRGRQRAQVRSPLLEAISPAVAQRWSLFRRAPHGGTLAHARERHGEAHQPAPQRALHSGSGPVAVVADVVTRSFEGQRGVQLQGVELTELLCYSEDGAVDGKRLRYPELPS